MMDFLNLKGSENVTQNIDQVIVYGFFSNMVFVVFSLYKQSLKLRQK